MPSTSWLTSLTCSTSSIDLSDYSSPVLLVVQWLRFIFLSPCPQRVLFSSIDLIFVVTLLLFLIRRLFSKFVFNSNSHSSSTLSKPLLVNNRSRFKVTLRFKLALFVTVLLAVAYTVLCVLAFTQSTPSSWKLVEALFRLAQAITHMAIVIILAHEKKFEANIHPLSLRIYWVVNFVIIGFFAASAITRLVSTNASTLEPNLRMDDIFSLVNLPLSIVLLIVALQRSSGISLRESEVVVNSTTQSYQPVQTDPNVSAYASASLFSKALWLWMNPLLTKGYKSPLKVDDVPTLPPEYRAERMSELFEMNWPKPDENSKHPVLVTLIRCFWKGIAITGFLAVVRLSVMYVGPLLIDSFIDFTASKRSSLYEGCLLVLVLLLAKTVESLSSHHFNFQCQKLAMLIRSSLITTLYMKGLKLSCSSRQAHGVGKIVNHMTADAQQLSGVMTQLHPIWMMPLQVGAALALLYGYLNVSMLAALFAAIAIGIFLLLRTQRHNFFQFSIMISRDKRLKATNEMLNNIRVIKFQAWEEHFSKKIQSFRGSEYEWIGKFLYSVSCNMALLGVTPVIIAALTFSAAVFLGIRLDTGTVFTVTTIIKILQEPVRSFPQALTQLSQAIIALQRLDGFFTSRELDENSVERDEGCDSNIAVEVKAGTFSWDDESNDVVLKVSDLEIQKGDLAAVVGTVGSGKSSLLASILGEMHKISGKVRVCGTVAYVPQTSWIQNATIQENILFGLPMNWERYKEVIRVCSLEKDLEMMEFGDQNEIGERGINLSGGQKQRIQLARAVYQDCDIYLLDDIFSAVDAQTGSDIFKACVRGALKDKTILLVTHQVDFLHNADLIMVMRDGMIVQSGKYEELAESGLDFSALVAAHETSMELVDTSNMSGGKTSLTPTVTLESYHQGESDDEKKPLSRSKSVKGTSKLIEDEERETGHVNMEVYKQYLTEAYGWWGVAVVILMSVLYVLSTMSGDYWLAYQTSADGVFNPNLLISVYWIIAAVSGAVVMGRSILIAFLGLKTGQSFFNGMLHSILHAPMSFFDTTPSGRILSRASGDQLNLDLPIPMFMSMIVVAYFTLLSIIFVTCQNAWPTVFLLFPLGLLNIWYRGYYLASSRELTRLDSITRAPVIHHFSESITGVMTIRGFRKQSIFCKENIDRVNANLRMDLHNNGNNEWLGLRLELIGNLFLCITTMFMIFLPSTIIRPENIGLSLSYGLSLNSVLFICVYMTCSIENQMVSVERIKQFTNIPSEAPWRITNRLPPKNWPSRGNIELKNLQVRYRPNTPLVLKGLSLSIQGGEKIGVVGRTGSGKSTLIQVFFRLVEPSGGQIIIDGINICTLGLHDLRSRFGIIPQDPVLFQGTVRSNVDPIGLYSDEEIWKSLERCQLKEVVAGKPEKLEAPVVDGGDNWSVGQRQLLCLGRIMLKRSKILFMDEATASVDSQTDAVIQKIIREDFATCTIISIAHRIPTVMDCDRVLVIDAGMAKEFDKPSHLLRRPSLFGSLVQEYSNRSSAF
ncbi:ABC transporter C family member 4 [Quillaja saponaria]|uniref:ABC-type xenobiotic transporter n=1 Tax=Quillaja saponaria TaxID=32244 RepID=A0AAD7VLQ4_QUISA|nr:ABC transporter C family member 4 [Quillaja saponaria]